MSLSKVDSKAKQQLIKQFFVIYSRIDLRQTNAKESKTA